MRRLKVALARAAIALALVSDAGALVCAAPSLVSAAPAPHAVAAAPMPSAATRRARARALGRRRRSIVPVGTPALTEPFSGATSAPYIWAATGDACLTAGPAPSPSPSPSPLATTGPPSTIPSCGANAPAVDPPGSGALELTQGATGQEGAVVYKTPFSTANGLQVVFTDYAFDGSSPGGDGVSLFLTDASQPFPAPVTSPVPSLGYIGMPGGYLGIGLDEGGNFSSSNGGPGAVPETIALRGETALQNPYLGGVTNASGVAASLPFNLDQPVATARPANAPTIRATILPTGEVIVEIDIHDGNGFLTYFDGQTVGNGGQPGLPAQVYLGFAASTSSSYNVHEIGALSVSYLQPASTAFAPTQIANLAAWYDASDPTTIGGTGTAVSTWEDKSGNGETLVQTNTSSMPVTGPNIDGLGALSFSGGQYLTSQNQLFSAGLFNASTVFVVTNQSNTLQSSSVLSAGSNASTQSRYDLRLSDNGETNFDFNNTGAGRLSVTTTPTGPALWTASGSLALGAQYLHKNGLNIASSTGPGTAANGAFPLLIGANLANSGTTYDYRGKIGEVLVFNSVLSQSDTATVEGYLACKWGLQTLLPANHPYARVCPPGIAPASSATIPAVPAGALVEPASLVSQNGYLTLSLVAQPDANGNPLLTYNGSSNPPTLRLLPGDVLTVNLTNNLPAPPSGATYLNDTNLHFHGLHVSPNAPADDSIDLLALPGQSLQYKIAIPVTHPPGLYWYHSHAHGEAERQNLAGMSGAIVIDGVAAYVPQVANMTEQILIARDTEPAGQPLPDANRKQIQAMFWAMKHANTSRARGGNAMPGMNMGSTRARMTMGSAIEVRGRTNAATRNPFVPVEARFRKMSRARFDASDGHCVGAETPVRGLTLNGATVPSITIAPGEQQFWRMVNAGSDTYLDVSLDNASLQIVSIDGVPISSGINTPSSLTVPDYILPPASRVEFIVTGPPAGTTSYLRTLCFDAGATGSAMPAAILASINPVPAATAPARPIQRISPRMRQYRFAHGKRRAAVVVARTQTLTYSDQNNIDGIAYDPAAPPKYYAQSGTYEEWTIVNNSQQVHTFHIHQIHFVLEAVNGIGQSQEYEMDNVNVPAASASGPGSVKILLDFTDPIDIGTFLLHCHILSHEDQGMMAKIMVGTAPPMSLSSSGVTFSSPSASAQSVTITGGAAPYSVTGCSAIVNAAVSGATVNLSPAAAGSCVLSVSDSSGQSANLPITVQAPPSAIAVSPTSVGFVSPSAAAQTVGISGGTGTYSTSTCVSSGTTVATTAIDAAGTGVTITPAADGACTVTITDTASDTATIPVSVNSGTTGNTADSLTFHHDVSRSGWYSDESTLTPSNVTPANFGLLTTLQSSSLTCPGVSSCPAFGKVYAQPLYASAENTSVDGKTHNLVIIATSTDQLYAIDDTTEQVVWEHNFTGNVNGTTVTQQSYADINCDDVNPNIGITGTPVIDRSQDMIYVVVPTKETNSNGTTWHMRLHAVSLSSGADENAVEVSASVQLATGGTASTNAEENNQRGALLEANGNIYVSLASHCDYDQTTLHGWLLSYSVANNLAPTGVALNTTNALPSSGDFLGSIWMSGYGPAADAQGNIYFVTGNGPWDGQNNFAMSAIKLPGNLDVANISYFTPVGWSADSGQDLDLGSGGIMLLPTLTSGNYPNVAVQQGKCGAGTGNGGDNCLLYLLNRNSMGGLESNNAGVLNAMDVTNESHVGSGIWGGPAMMQDASGNNYVFIGGGNLTNYKVTFNGSGVPQLTAMGSINSSIGCLECRDSGSQPIVSSNGTLAGTAVVWALQTPADGQHSGNGSGDITLYAFNPSNMSTTLYSAVAGTWMDDSGSYIAGALVSPLVANGKVYVPSDGTVTVFGLKQ